MDPHMPYFCFPQSNMCQSSILLRLALQKDTIAENLLRVSANNPQGILFTPPLNAIVSPQLYQFSKVLLQDVQAELCLARAPEDSH